MPKAGRRTGKSRRRGNRTDRLAQAAERLLYYLRFTVKAPEERWSNLAGVAEHCGGHAD